MIPLAVSSCDGRPRWGQIALLPRRPVERGGGGGSAEESQSAWQTGIDLGRRQERRCTSNECRDLVMIRGRGNVSISRRLPQAYTSILSTSRAKYDFVIGPKIR